MNSGLMQLHDDCHLVLSFRLVMADTCSIKFM